MKIDVGLGYLVEIDGVVVSVRWFEECGYDGMMNVEMGNDLFLLFVVVVEYIKFIEFYMFIVVVFVCNFMFLVNLGYDLNVFFKGCFILGLGSQIWFYIEK